MSTNDYIRDVSVSSHRRSTVGSGLSYATAAIIQAYLQYRARLAYAYVPPIYSVNGHHIHMARISGRSLREILDTSPDRYGELRQAATHALTQLHAHNLTHGDNSLSNYLVDVEDHIWIVDFASAELTSDPVKHRRDLDDLVDHLSDHA